MELLSIELHQLKTNLIQLGLAFLLPLLTAWEREAKSRSAGLRTFPLVSITACSFTILAMSTFTDPTAQARVIGGIVTGIGFIGGGAILKDHGDVSGISTAAAIWSTGAVGVAIGMGRLEIALVLSLITLVIVLLFGRLKEEVDKND